jgi:hypothetical protein
VGCNAGPNAPEALSHPPQQQTCDEGDRALSKIEVKDPEGDRCQGDGRTAAPALCQLGLKKAAKEKLFSEGWGEPQREKRER